MDGDGRIWKAAKGRWGQRARNLLLKGVCLKFILVNNEIHLFDLKCVVFG